MFMAPGRGGTISTGCSRRVGPPLTPPRHPQGPQRGEGSRARGRQGAASRRGGTGTDSLVSFTVNVIISPLPNALSGRGGLTRQLPAPPFVAKRITGPGVTPGGDGAATPAGRTPAPGLEPGTDGNEGQKGAGHGSQTGAGRCAGRGTAAPHAPAMPAAQRITAMPSLTVTGAQRPVPLTSGQRHPLLAAARLPACQQLPCTLTSCQP